MTEQLHDEVRRRMGVLPNFFRLAPKHPEITQNLWGFACFGYLDNPLPSLFKERLFVWLSRFCEVRYCIVRHAGFLVGLGRVAGDADCPTQSIDDMLVLLRKPVPRDAALRAHIARCSALGQPLTELPPPDSELELAIFACATHVFLQASTETQCLDALHHALGASRMEHLLVFIAFVRTAHEWTKLHPELTFEDDVRQLMATHQPLRHCLLDDPEAKSADIKQRLLGELDALRQEKQQVMRESEARLQQDLADSRLLHDISNELIGEQNIDALYGKIVAAAARLMRAPCASIQILLEERGGVIELQQSGHRDRIPQPAKRWERVQPGAASSAGAALASGRRVVVPDVEHCTFMAGTEDLGTYRMAGIHAVQSTPLHSRDGALVGAITTHWHEPHEPSEHQLQMLDILARQTADLIGRARADAALHASEERLRNADRMKDQFLATLAHELRNPLAPISTALHLLRHAGQAAPSPTILNILDRQVSHMVRLIDDLLEMSRISRGVIELQRAPLELADVLRTAADASAPLIERGGHRLQLHFPQDSLPVHGDAVRLTQVFTNILNNAAKYTDDGGNIALSACRDGGQAVVSVCDNGVGLAAEQLPRLFEMFAQMNPGGAQARGGLGIGLSLARNLIQMHGGTIEAQSGGLEQGSCFTVRLPLVQHGSAPGSVDQHAAAADLRTLRILVVDDNRDAADSLGALLGILGSEVRVAHSGTSALATLDEWQPSVLLLDLGMPGMDGYEVARRIRADRRNDGVLLVALTGWGQPEDRERTSAAGFDHHLIKPADIAVLKDLLASRLQQEGRGLAP
jgi:signal transduction histidine kinase/ActR/RegA family two-component response regulator